MSAPHKSHPVLIAAEMPRCRTSGELLLLIEGSAIAFAFVLSLLAMLMFMMITIADRVETLIKEQNTAALKLSDELQYFRDHRLQNDHSVPPGLFSDLVEFSRNTAIIKNEVDRLLNLELIWKQPLHKSEVDDPSSYHVDPNTDGDKIWQVGNQQIGLYQLLRDRSQEACTSYKDVRGAISTYLLPLLYALLGAFLCDLRCRMTHKSTRGTPLSSARYTTAIIAGAVIGTCTSLIPASLSLSPLLVAFLIGYSVDIFTARLDGLIDKLRTPDGGI